MKRLIVAILAVVLMATSSFAAIKVRRDTAANWTSNNPTLASGEKGYETDTKQEKVGDGATAWTALGYTYQLRAGATYAVSSTTTASGAVDIPIDGLSADHYYYGTSAGAVTYTATLTNRPASGRERSIVLTIGGGTSVCTLASTNITWLSATAPTLVTTTNKKLSFACFIPASGNALCNAIGGAHD